MSHQITTLDLIPNGEIITCNASQFDNGRVLPFAITENKEAYNIPSGVRVELHCRKPDGNIVTLPSENITDNIVTFLSTTQLTACYGNNICEIALYGPDDYLIGSANFILDVEKSPTLGGITSTSEINNLEEQIEEITTEIVGENYYTKTETDNKLALKANAADVYTKSQVDSALALKANAADVYTKSQVDSALALKANAADVYTKTQVDSALTLKANAADVYTKAETDAKIEDAIEEILPVDTAGPSAIASFTTGIALPLVNCKVDIVATGGNGTPDNPIPIVGYTEANITANGDTITISFGQTVYGGVLDVTRGKLRGSFGDSNLSDITGWSYVNGFFRTLALASIIKNPTSQSTATNALCSIYNSVSWTACGDNDYEFAFNSSNGELIIKDSRYSDVPSFLAGVSGIPLAYELATPFDIDLTPVQIEALLGVNNVFSDTNGNTIVKYKDSIQHYIDCHTGG